MLDVVLDGRAFLGLLVAFAVVSPPACWVAFSRSWIARRRIAIALGASGPAVLVLWGVHNAVLATLGFASVWSLLAMLGGGAVIGAAVGYWIRGERPAPAHWNGDA